MVNFWQVSNVALKSSHWRCSIKKAVLKNLAMLNLYWSLFLINLQAYKPVTLLERDSNIGFFLWILRYFKGHLWATASELYWFKMEEIIEKTETYPEAIIVDVFRIQWNIKDEAFCKNSCLYLTVDYFCKTLHINCSTELWICLDETKQHCNLCKFIFKLYFIFTLLPCRETLITNWKHVSFISNWFTLVAEYI